MTILREYIWNMVMYSMMSSYCMHLMPSKKYKGLAEVTIGLGYISMMLDYLKIWLEAWQG